MRGTLKLLSGCLVLTVGGLIGLAQTAQAIDGAWEIDPDCVATGCPEVDGDTAGWPVTITVPGNYMLTGNLVVPNQNTDAINVTVAGVSIDLNRFAILGPTSCTSCPASSCTNAGTGRGIYNSVALGGNLAVQNGFIKGMGANGISISGGGLALIDFFTTSNGGTGVRVVSGGTAAFRAGFTYNGGDGLNGDPGYLGTMKEVQAACNANEGIEVGVASTVTDSTAVGNGGTGIYTGNGSSLNGNVSDNNVGVGIRAVDANLVGNTARGNGSDGFLIVGGSTVTVNTAQGNGGDGFDCGDGVIVSTSTARSNTGKGLVVGTGSGYLANSLTCNNGNVCDNAAQVSGAGISLGSNICGTDTTCP